MERNESTTSCQPHITTASTTLLQKQHAISRAKMWASRRTETSKRCFVRAHNFFNSLKAERMSMEPCSHFLQKKTICHLSFQQNSHTACPSVMALLPTQSSPTSSLSGSAGPWVCGMLLYVEGEGNGAKTV